MQTTIAELTSAEIPQICTLFQNVFGIGMTPQQWAWKYQQGPRLGSVNMVVRGPSGNLLGHAGTMVFPGVNQASPLAMAQVCDLLLDPSVRGGIQTSSVYSRLFQALQKTTSERFNGLYAYGFAGPRVYKLGRRMGFYGPEQCIYPAYIGDMDQTPKPKLWSVCPMGWDTRRLDRIWARYASHVCYPKTARTGAYLHWRYANHPNCTYHAWAIQHCFRDYGWFITRTMPNGHTYIVDVLSPARESLPILIAALIREMRLAGWHPSKVIHWNSVPEANSPLEPVLAGEFSMGASHSEIALPTFYPGDTDVY